MSADFELPPGDPLPIGGTPLQCKLAAAAIDLFYAQGVQALAALGPASKVDCALSHYVATNAYRVARPADLISALTTVFPNAAAVLARFGVQP